MEMPCAESLDVQAGHQEALFNLWSRYLTKAEKHDKKLVETWKGDADGILIFTGLFSAMVAAFTLESYKTLQPDPSATVVLLLSQISHQLAAPANDTGSPTVPTPPFHAPSSGVRVNILWFLSLCLSVSCALAAMLMQQWSRKYLHLAHGHHLDQYTGARVRAFLFLGVTKFRMTDALEFVPSILHVAVFLFFAGMVEFLLPIHRTVAVAVLCCVIFISGIYGLVTALPLLFPDCPYQTPLSPLLRQFVYGLVAGYSAMRSLLTRVAARSRSSGGSQPSFTSTALPPNPSVNWYPLFSLNGSHDPVEAALKPQLNVVATALASELTSLKGVADFEGFFEGTHALLSLDHTVQSSLTVLVIQHRPKLARMLTRLFDSCTPSSDTLDSTWNRRALIGIHALWDIFFSAPPTEVHTFKTLLSIPFFVLGQRAGEPWDPVYALRAHKSVKVAVTARCIQAWDASFCIENVRSVASTHTFGRTITALLDPPLTLRDEIEDAKGLWKNGCLMWVVGFLHEVLPAMRSVDGNADQIAKLVGDIIDTKAADWEERLEDPWVQASQPVQDAFAELFAEVETLSRWRRGSLPWIPKDEASGLERLVYAMRRIHYYISSGKLGAPGVQTSTVVHDIEIIAPEHVHIPDAPDPGYTFP